jgi:chorismate synthase
VSTILNARRVTSSALADLLLQAQEVIETPNTMFSGFPDVSFATQEVLDLARTELDSVGSNISITEQAIDAGLILPCGDHVRDLLIEIKKAPSLSTTFITATLNLTATS